MALWGQCGDMELKGMAGACGEWRAGRGSGQGDAGGKEKLMVKSTLGPGLRLEGHRGM